MKNNTHPITRGRHQGAPTPIGDTNAPQEKAAKEPSRRMPHVQAAQGEWIMPSA